MPTPPLLAARNAQPSPSRGSSASAKSLDGQLANQACSGRSPKGPESRNTHQRLLSLNPDHEWSRPSRLRCAPNPAWLSLWPGNQPYKFVVLSNPCGCRLAYTTLQTILVYNVPFNLERGYSTPQKCETTSHANPGKFAGSSQTCASSHANR